MAARNEFTLVLRPGEEDYANCSGIYKRTLATLRGRDMWFNSPKKRVIFFNGSTWTITSTKEYLVVICEGATGGFYSAKDAPTEPYQANWCPRYDVGYC